ncbi:MAG TPA: alpha/beta fold hydrolase, partial [Pyrinomonadaceae bacterium]|nr:alpha/beta fold hydrolase [Pyrinomonadaceae bacterium]
TLALPATSYPGTRLERPETRYAKSSNINIAYQVIGHGPIDIVYVPGWVSHVEYGWESPLVASFYRGLASFARLILFDKRGTGLSDQTTDLPTLEQRMDDVRAVMEAVDSSRAVVFGMSEGGNMSLVFAATYPERTVALITFGAFAKREWDPEYPWAPTREVRQQFYDALESEWGGPIGIEELAPSLAHDQSFRDWWATYQRRSASPRAAVRLARMNTTIDVRNVLPAIRVPTMVLHRTGDLDCHVDEGRYIAARIPGAKFVELPGSDHLIFAGDQKRVLNEVESFIRNIQDTPETESVLATVLFAEAAYDQAASAARFLSLAKREADWFKGRVGNAPGRFVATFDGPVRAIRCAAAMRDAAGRAGLDSRIALHTGLCEISGDQISGLAVDTSAAIAALAEPGEVLVSTAVRDLVSGVPIDFEERGRRDLGPELGQWQLSAVKRSD